MSSENRVSANRPPDGWHRRLCRLCERSEQERSPETFTLTAAVSFHVPLVIAAAVSLPPPLQKGATGDFSVSFISCTIFLVFMEGGRS